MATAKPQPPSGAGSGQDPGDSAVSLRLMLFFGLVNLPVVSMFGGSGAIGARGQEDAGNAFSGPCIGVGRAKRQMFDI